MMLAGILKLQVLQHHATPSLAQSLWTGRKGHVGSGMQRAWPCLSQLPAGTGSPKQCSSMSLNSTFFWTSSSKAFTPSTATDLTLAATVGCVAHGLGFGICSLVQPCSSQENSIMCCWTGDCCAHPLTYKMQFTTLVTAVLTH